MKGSLEFQKHVIFVVSHLQGARYHVVSNHFFSVYWRSFNVSTARNLIHIEYIYPYILHYLARLCEL